MGPLFGQEKLARHQIPNSNPTMNQDGLQNSGHFPAGSKPSSTTALRKYLVILQDSVAIKFVPLVPGHQSHPYPLAFNNNNSSSNTTNSSTLNNKRRDRSSVGSNSNSSSSSHSNSSSGGKKSMINSNNNEDENEIRRRINYVGSEKSENFISGRRGQEHLTNCRNDDPHGLHMNPSSNNNINNYSQDKSMRLQAFNNNFRTALGSATAEVDHSLHGLYLYKGFREANVQCYWNAALSETFLNIEYKGYIVPSVILVSATLPRFLTILRTAWARQMLRSPPGYRIEFCGEIDELLAEPIEIGQFAPLSDSLCWTILELTSIGEEAFVDSIMNALRMTFPTMACPTRELVYQTLETLTRERKVYQTSRGYFVVTPDTLRYINTNHFQQHQGIGNRFSYNPALTLDALMANNYESDKHCFSRQSRDSGVSGEQANLSNDQDLFEINEHEPRALKRHNSLKTFRQKDLVAMQSTSNNGSRNRSSSFRLAKSKSCDRIDDDKDDDDEEVKGSKARRSTLNHIASVMRNFKRPGIKDESKSTKDVEKNNKGKSLLSKIFQFRRSNSKPRNCASSPSSPKSSPDLRRKSSRSFNKSEERSVSSSTRTSSSSKETQTSSSTERLVPPSTFLSQPESSSSGCRNDSAKNKQNSSLHTSPSSSTMRGSANGLRDELLQSSTSPDPNNILLGQPRPDSRRSISTPEGHSPLYEEVPHELTLTRRSRSPAMPPNFPSFHREESSRCSTLSQGTSSLSLGYASQGYPSLTMSNGGYFNCNSASHSPCEVNYDPSQPQVQQATTETKPNGYSNGYKTSYDFYRRRYPSYSSSINRGAPHYATLTGQRVKDSGNAGKNTPRSVEPLLTTTMSNRNSPGNNNKSTNRVGSKPNDPSSSSLTQTTVTQNVKSTTDMELELLLPLGNIMKAALNAKKQSLKDQFFRREYNREPPIQEGLRDETGDKIPLDLQNAGIQMRVGEPKSQTEIKTTVDNNGLIETHFHTLPGQVLNSLSSTIEIEANGENKVIVTTNKSRNSKNSGGSSKQNKKVVKKSTRNEGVKVTDIGRDSEEDVM